MEKLPAIMFFPKDWIADPIGSCSIAAQGLWLRMMFLMHDSEQYGYLCVAGVPTPPEVLSRRCGTPLEQYTTLLAELDMAGVPSRTEKGIIYSRRMVRDEKKRVLSRRNGRKGGNPALIRVVNPPLKPTLYMDIGNGIGSENPDGGSGGRSGNAEGIRAATLAVFSRWSHVSRQHGISEINNEHRPIFDLIESLNQGPPVLRNGGAETIPAGSMVSVAAELCITDGKPFKGVKYAVKTVENIVKGWVLNGLGNAKSAGRKTGRQAQLDETLAAIAAMTEEDLK